MNNLNYGIIGNCQSAALISDKGSIDWCCLPRFDSPSIFAKILDKNIGGSFEILVDEDYKITQSYINQTNILVTKFTKRSHSFEIVDFMPRYYNENGDRYSPPDIIRYIRYLSGKPSLRIKYNPQLEYAFYHTENKIFKSYIKSFTTKGSYDSIYLYTDLEKGKIQSGDECQ